MLRVIAIGFGALFLLAHNAMAQSCSGSTWTNLANGNPADASKVMSNFNCVLTSPYFSGSVGIGTTSPTQALEVKGSLGDFAVNVAQGTTGEVPSGASMYTLSNNLTIVGNGFGTAGYKTQIAYYNGSGWYSGLELAHLSSGYGNLILMKSGGSVGIGTTTPGYTLYVNGTAAGPSGFQTASDGRLKKNIVPLSDGLALIHQLQPVRFDFRSREERKVGQELNLPPGRQIGFIAQDLDKVLPEAVSVAKSKEAIMSVAESKVVPVLVEAVKELQQTNERQSVRIFKLEARIAMLERKSAVHTAKN